MPTKTANIPCPDSQPVEITFHDCGKVTAAAGQEQAEFSFPLAGRKSYRIQSALLSGQNNTLTLNRRNPAVSTVLTAGSGLGTVSVQAGADSRKQKYQTVRKIEVFAQKVIVTYHEENAPQVERPVDSPVRTPGGNSPSVSALEQENARLKGLVNQGTELVRKLSAENAALKSEKDGLMQAVEQGIDNVIDQMRNGQLSSTPQLQSKIDQLTLLRTEAANRESQAEALEKQIQDQISANANAAARLQSLQDQLAGLQAQEETTNLDCDQAARELEALRTRLQLNGDIVALTEDRWLKNNSVSDTLKETGKKLDAVEKRIGLILNARELYNSAVQSAVLLTGDGTLSAADESGNSTQPAPENTEEDSEN